MKRKLLQLALLLMLLPAQTFAISLTPTASRMDVIKYLAIFIVGCVIMFFLLIRLTIIPFLVRSYYSYSDATNIGLSLFFLYAVNLFTLLFFRLYTSAGWYALFCVMGFFWFIHFLIKVLLARRSSEN